MNSVLVGQNQGTTLREALECASLLIEILLQGFCRQKKFFDSCGIQRMQLLRAAFGGIHTPPVCGMHL